MSGATSRRKGQVFEQQMRRWLGEHPRLAVVEKSHLGESEPDAVVELRAVEAPAYPGDDPDPWTCRLVFEFKNHAKLALPEWWAQAEGQQRAYASTEAWPVLVHKRRGVSGPSEQWVTMTTGEFVELLLAVAQ